MINGKLETWQVLRFLQRNSECTAEAPDTDYFFPCDASSDEIHTEFVTHFPGGDSSVSPPNRSDWTILRDGKPIQFRQKSDAHRCRLCSALGRDPRVARTTAFMLRQTAEKLNELANKADPQ